MNITKVPPHNLEAEQAVLASMLIDKEAIIKIGDQVRIDDFYSDIHQLVAYAILELYEKNQPADLITTNSFLKDNPLYAREGGSLFLNDLVELIPTSANVEYYLKIVQDKAERRKLISTCSELVTETYLETDIADLIEQAETKIFNIAKNRIGQDLFPIKPVLNLTIQNIKKQYHNKGFSGIPSGFTDLDSITGGFQKSDLIIIAGRPSMGKTALALNIAQNISETKNQGIIFFSLEMTKMQLCQRMISSHSKIDSQKLRTGRIAERDFPKLSETVNTLSKTRIFIDDSPSISSFEMRAKSRRLITKESIDLIVIDYLQLISLPTGRKSENRQNEIAEISRSLKVMARELEVPVIVLSQLSRMVEVRGGDHRPKLSDLRDSGAIEQDADLVMFVYRDEYYHPEDPDVRGTAELIIAKQRNGPTGTISLAFDSSITKFKDFAKYH